MRNSSPFWPKPWRVLVNLTDEIGCKFEPFFLENFFFFFSIHPSLFRLSTEQWVHALLCSCKRKWCRWNWVGQCSEAPEYYDFSEKSRLFFLAWGELDTGQCWLGPHIAATCLWDVLLTSYFSSVSAGCAAKQKYHTHCENPRSAQSLPREIVTFCDKIGMSELEEGKRKKNSF